jgi:hypothetical protein
MINSENICIATITWARDEAEEKLLRDSLQQLALLQLPVFITDGGSRRDFLDFLKSFQQFNVMEAKEKGLMAQVKSSLSAAHLSGAKFIFYTEPDKLLFFQQHLPNILNELSFDEQAGIILMERTVKGFSSFPPFQQMTETTINNCCAEIIGTPLDYTYGPFLLNSKLVPYLDLVKEDIAWGWRPYIFSIANRLGYKIESVIDDFFCPIGQQQASPAENIYRMRQLKQNIEGLLISTTVTI